MESAKKFSFRLWFWRFSLVDYDDLGEYIELRSNAGEMFEAKYGNPLPQKNETYKNGSHRLKHVIFYVAKGRQKGLKKHLKIVRMLKWFIICN